ncbi:PREDICTED: uncharacterized protein LOC107192351 [Dufourea novaeangliae]|uniref:uncharacterized protein LOC107192351 n=1 Tax=Dufourea novaeangliae TaxID=178035 RepID=UPI0007673824|nr:PREDICTED: uncharacterized protein LOC107192351 [Dufourea novaeangliae]
MLKVTALILPEISRYRPIQLPGLAAWPHFEGLTLADPHYAAHHNVDVLLDADVYNRLLLDDVRRGECNQSMAQETRLGWILTGDLQKTSEVKTSSGALPRRQEEVRVEVPPTPDDEGCEQHFKTTYSRMPEGRFMVRLAFHLTPHLGTSRSAALRALESIQRRFRKDEDFERAYRAFMHDYATLEYMEVARRPPLGLHFYLPHHGVLKATTTTTKLRVVFNGSRSTSSGKSLNDCLYTGPNLLPPLADVFQRWRRHLVTFTADVEKMYRQILVHEDDQDYQWILWRAEHHEKVTDYTLSTVTYGLACAPYLALRCLQQLATDKEAKFPLGAAVIRVSGSVLRKWASNSPKLLEGSQDGESSAPLHWDSESTHSVVGLRWLPNSDEFQVNVAPQSADHRYTKRTTLSQAAQIFDPLGWLAPVTVWAKIFTQGLRLLKTDWDAALPPQEEDRWTKFFRELVALDTIKISRWLGLSPDWDRVEFHGFADASKQPWSTSGSMRTSRELESVWSLPRPRSRH